MGANTHPTTELDGVDAKTKAERLRSKLENVENVSEVRTRDSTVGDSYIVEIELENPMKLNAEVMSVVSEAGYNISSGCIESGMNPFRVYVP